MNISLITIVLLFCFTCSSKEKVKLTANISTAVDTTVVYNIDSLGINTNYVMGQFEPSSHPQFDVIPAKYCDNEIRYLRKDALKAFIEMAEKAKKDGIILKIVSATRNFDRQKVIWEKKWTGATLIGGTINAATTYKNPVDRASKILEYSSMPGTSRHHWGTDIDINSVELSYFQSANGKNVYNWLKQNGHNFGYCQTYTPFDSIRTKGYFEEKWHWTYMPVSSKITVYVEKNIHNDMISGFLGSETATKIDIVNNYMLSINPACK